MSEKTAKPKKAQGDGGQGRAGVLGNLPATRTTRVGGERSRGTAPKPKPKATPRDGRRSRRPPRSRSRRRARARPTPPPDGPRPVRAGAPALKESTERARSEASEPRERGSPPPSGTELVTTAIQAAGELAQIGLTVGGQVLKRAVKRLPKP